MKKLNTLGRRLVDSINAVFERDKSAEENKPAAGKVHVSGAGRALTFAYEQLRNAAEYADDHLLLYAIKRFYKRIFITRDEYVIKDSSEELIVELTMAGYIKNDSVNASTVKKIQSLTNEYFVAYEKLKKEKWTIDVLASEVEKLLVNDIKRDSFAQFAYDYFARTIKREKLPNYDASSFEVSLFVAVQKALLKTNPATIRMILLNRYRQKPSLPSYQKTNEMIDQVLSSKSTESVHKVVYYRSAPLRVLWRLIESNEDALKAIENSDDFLALYKSQIKKEYGQINKRINRGVVKSVVFLVITKVLIGMAIEIPYDNIISGSILLIPLIVNLLFPPIYMVLLRFTLQLPGAANTNAMIGAMEDILYDDESSVVIRPKKTKAKQKSIFNIIYWVFSIGILGSVVLLLSSIGFEFLHLVIFFTFISAASFLGFRLSRQIRELEIIDGQQNGITMLRDFVYLPFVVMGRWISEKYSKINIVAFVLDMAIELPLKTVLRLVRQWGVFIASKKDEL